jgi:sugar lactone lactonase YvrE
MRGHGMLAALRPFCGAGMTERIVYALFGLIAIVLAAFGWSMWKWETVYGPTYAAVFDDERVMIASGATLYDLDARGNLLRKFKLATVKLGPIVTDFQPLRDGTALVGDANAGAIMRCDFYAYRCVPLYAAQGPAGRLAPAFKMAVDEARRRVYVADTQNHRILVLGLDGTLLGSTEQGGPELQFPNELVLLPGNRLAVADTENGRIAILDVSGDAIAPALAGEIAAHSTVEGVPMDPIALRVAPDGRLWVILSNNGLELGAVAVFDLQGKREKLLPTAEIVDPLSLAMLGDKVLVLDPSSVAVDVVGLDGRGLKPFGSAQFQAELDRTAMVRAVYGAIRAYAGIVLILLLVLAIALHLLTRRGRMQERDGEQAAA